MLTHLSVILTNLAITLLLVGFIWYYFKNKVENLENILNYQSQILKNAIQSNTLSNNDYLTNETETHNKINVVLDNEDEEDEFEDGDDDEFEDGDDYEDDEDDEDDENVDEDVDEEHDIDDETVEEVADELVNEVVDELVDDENNTKQIKVISLELGSDAETNENNKFFQEDNTNENLNIEKVEENMENNQSIDDVSEPSYNPLNQEKVENVENMETEINNQEKYGKYNVKQLREHALEKNLGDAKIIKNMKKQELLTLILNNETNP